MGILRSLDECAKPQGFSPFLNRASYRSCEFYDLTKHPDTEEAMRDKWLNEGSNGTLNSLMHKSR